MSLKMLCRHAMRIYLNDVETCPVRVFGDFVSNTIEYVVKVNCQNARVRVQVDSDNRYIQSTFVCSPKHISIVNANDRRSPCIFDGFVSEEDESVTQPFKVTRLHSLRENHGLNVHDMAKAMEQNVILTIFINEAHVFKKTKWYTRIWLVDAILANNIDENDDKIHKNYANCISGGDINKNDIHDDQYDDETQLIAQVKNTIAKSDTLFVSANNNNNHNKSMWAPIECQTGKFIVTVQIKFIF
ncbi:AC17 [Trabala vishnou gigantina nucleopolyhedrovirus]|uniref:AC17 n=1 Tax=Trabala vishnou gigantina nucleopolyhedrovirus TaxID=2863583 RepID=UPI002482007C|nr:AC17 [Trabala vishnou gigantina nucleopolyhedrovirus]QYC92726.1 AC17 [Trabala vishnou gigantina nucleopolyhedrovirus]